MGKFTVIPQDTFDALQLDAGILLKQFNPVEGTFNDADIICATTGGINVSCVPTYSDFGEDVDNCPVNMMELKHLDSWECKFGFTALGTSPELIRFSLGAADVSGNSVVPRRDLEQTDFAGFWWVGDKADGGMVAVQLMNGLSTSGFSLQTSKNGKGQISCELTGHVSIQAQDVVPMLFYSTTGDGSSKYKVLQSLFHITSSFTGTRINAGDDFETTLTASTGYTITNVVVTLGGEDVTSEVYTSGTGKVEIESVDGDIAIFATAAE